MIKKLTRLLGNIVGGIKKKKMMVSILMGLIGILLPIGAAFFILAFQSVDDKLWALVYCFIGLMFWGLGIWVWVKLKDFYQDEEDKHTAEYLTQLQVLETMRKDFKSSLELLVSEMKGLREDLRGVKNEHTDTSDRK